MTTKDTIKAIQKAVGTTADGIWGPNTSKAVSSALGCDAGTVAIQCKVGVTADGIVGPKTIAAIYDRLSHCASPQQPQSRSVFIDPGHTSDYEREHPTQFKKVDWKSGKPREIMCILGLDRNPNDSVEHALNCLLANALNEALHRLSFETVLYDNPNLSNCAEICQVYSRSNSFRPSAFVSIHNNAQGGSKWESLGGTASGTVGLYDPVTSNNRKLAKALTDAVNAYRKSSGGPNNRAETLKTSGVAVLSKALPVIPACLIEVGFYDNIDDLYWMCTHAKGIAAAMADGIASFISSNT